MTNDWGTYLRSITGDSTGAEIARRLGVSDSKVSYWKRGERPPTIAEAIQVSRVYGRPPLEGLIAAGYLDPDEVSDAVAVQPVTLRQFTDAQLAEELLRRTTKRTA
ncbi:helix-turn-helix domain-containing protein [Microbacterium caowuchunii]|uniref:Helix-turn-helix transcriptional regulator n=1 Tax=Microbacterium caowuchunii TaxID=2614638 RepID=A0A5N0TIL9_9MICO|nr:helix-turn-helix transcriptional regulator [Microbacterium caowuchunii]KAA9133726.1 helix-turn-helix transcriptional regulator [Microbacterium caowuchunii]